LQKNKIGTSLDSSLFTSKG